MIGNKKEADEFSKNLLNHIQAMTQKKTPAEILHQWYCDADFDLVEKITGVQIEAGYEPEYEASLSEARKVWQYKPIIEQARIYTEITGNGLLRFDENYLETHFEMVAHIRENEEHHNGLRNIQEREGRTGFYSLAKEWTDEFQLLHQEREWDGEWWDEVDAFVKQKLNEKRLML